MGWAAFRIHEYQLGKQSTWLERRMLEHANPLHFMLAVIAVIGFSYGLWMHDWIWIVGATVLSIVGHVYTMTWKSGHDTIKIRILNSKK